MLPLFVLISIQTSLKLEKALNRRQSPPNTIPLDVGEGVMPGCCQSTIDTDENVSGCFFLNTAYVL